MNETFTHPEAGLPERFGNVSRNTLRELRGQHLVEQEDWILDGGRIMLSDEGLQKIAALLQVETPKNNPAASAGAAQDETLLVWRADLPNPRIILAYKPGTSPHEQKNLLRVRVRSSANFARHLTTGKPMEVPVRHIQADLYELTRPCPRWKGRW